MYQALMLVRPLALMVETLAALGLKQLAHSRGRRDLPAAP